MAEYGLNKAERLKAERKERQQEDAPLPLDPEFPYQVRPFDPLFFGVREEWPPEEV